MGIEGLFAYHRDAAILAHLDDVEAARRILVHPVPAFELGGDALYRAFDAKRLAAADAGERLLLLEHPRCNGCIAKGEARYEGDDFFWAGRFAQTALHAGIFGKTQQRPIRVIRQRAGRAYGHAGKAEGATLGVDLDGAERCPSRQPDDIDGGGSRMMEFAQREPQHISLAADREEAGGTGNRLYTFDREGLPQNKWIVGLDRREGLAREP